jgi:hypothetical protein
VNPRPPSNAGTIAAIGVVAYAAADMVHELGHALAATVRHVPIESISTVAIQTAETSRVVASAGTIADVGAGLLAFALLQRKPSFTPGQYFLWLFGCVSLMNCGYLVFSGVTSTGDWAVVVNRLNPSWAWRAGIVTIGIIAYMVAMRLAARMAAVWIETGQLSRAELRRITVFSYVAGGLVMVMASAMNPVGVQLVLTSGVGASFGLTWGLLLIPRMIRSVAAHQDSLATPLPLHKGWIAAGLLVAIGFVGVLGPGIQLR